MTNASRTFPGPTEHQHTRRCWWNYEEARWVCAAAPPPAPDTAAEPEQPLVDVHDMAVAHTALLR